MNLEATNNDETEDETVIKFNNILANFYKI